MKKRIFILLILLLTACSGGEAVGETAVSPTLPIPTSTIIPATPADVVTAVTTSAVTATVVLAPSPSLHPTITINLQTVKDDGVLIIDDVRAIEAGWLAIYAERSGQTGEMLAYTAVSEGSNSNITVAIPPMLATENLIAILYAGDNEAEFDPETAVITHPFTVTLSIVVPVIAITDQTINEDGVVEFESIYTAVDGWIVLYRDDNGVIGRPLAHQFIEAGENKAVRVPIPLDEATERLHTTLFIDKGTARHYESDEVDTAVFTNGNLVNAVFEVTLPPSILTYDQPLLDDKIIIDRAVSDGAGWLIAYDDPGTTSAGIIVGSVPLADGLNEMVSMTISVLALDTIYLRLHNNGEELNKFDVLGDLPIVMEDGRLPPPAIIHTNKESYLITRDQPVKQDGDVSSVTIPLIAAARPVWVVINNDNEEIIGTTLLPAGLNRNVIISVNSDDLTETLSAVLHRDDGEVGEFEYPDDDAPLQRNFELIKSPFQIGGKT